MLNKRIFRVMSVSFMLIGLVFILNSLSGITGAVVFENVSGNLSGMAGLVFIVVGVLLLMAGEREKSSLEDAVDGIGRKVIIPDRFIRAIRGHDVNRIKKAIAKIGTGKGNEEFLKHIKKWSVRTGEGQYRLIYDRNPEGAVLLDYSGHYKEY